MCMDEDGVDVWPVAVKGSPFPLFLACSNRFFLSTPHLLR